MITYKSFKKIKKVVAILARFIENSDKPLGKQTNLIKNYFKESDNLNIFLVILRPCDLFNYRGSGQDCNGFYWGTDIQKWRIGKFNFPSVVYDRFYSSLEGFDKTVQYQKHYIEQVLNLPFLNPVAFSEMLTDKRIFAQKMSEIGLLTPETNPASLNSPGRLWDQVMEYRSMILKPRFGRMGKCIIRLDAFRKSVTVIYSNRIFRAENKWNLKGIVQYFLSQNRIKPENMILQKTIRSPQIDDRFFDIRVLVQRRCGEQKPIITGEVARLSQSFYGVPNIDQGGIVIPLDQCLSLIFKSKNQQLSIHNELRNYALYAYHRLEMDYGLIGEIGIDILIDKESKIWMVEMNSKPGRIAFERLASGFGLTRSQKEYFAKQRKLSILNPVKYCQWLANQ